MNCEICNKEITEEHKRKGWFPAGQSWAFGVYFQTGNRHVKCSGLYQLSKDSAKILGFIPLPLPYNVEI